MNDQPKGHCKHGDFIITEGCPECVAEKLASTQEAPPVSIIKVRFINQTTGEPEGREYAYLTEEPLDLDCYVKAPTQHSLVEAVVTALDVPEAEIAAFRDKVKTIPAGSKMVRLGDRQVVPEIETTQVESPTNETPPVAQFASIFNKLPDPEPGQEVAIIEDAGEPVAPEEKPPALVTIQNQVGKPAPELFQLYQEAVGLLRFAKIRVIATAEDLKPATDDLVIIAKCRKAMSARRSELVGPLRAKLDLVNQAFNDIMFPVEEADQLTRGKVTKFDQDQRARAAEAKRIEDEKFRLAQDEAKFTRTGEYDVPLRTIEEVAPPSERTRTDLGTLGGRDNWKARVVDMKLLPDEYKLPDMQMLNAKARSSKGTAEISGVEFYNDRTTTIRTKQ